MADENKVNVTQRHEFADYMNVSEDSTTKKWALMGTGFTSLNESPNAQTNSKKYVNQKSTSTTVTHYETQFPYETDLIPDEEAVASIYKVSRNHLVGSDAQREYVRVELWNPISGSTKEFTARKFLVSVEVSSVEGENDQTISGNLNAVGDPVDGIFNTETQTFTEVVNGKVGNKTITASFLIMAGQTN